MPLAKREAVSKEMLDNDIIERSDSEYCNPIHPVFKRDGSVRLVLDARAINRVILTQRDQPESIEEILQKFAGTRYLSSLDMTSSYWQLELDKDSRKYTAFFHNGRCYHFKRMPFGLNISSAAFVRALDEILGEELLQDVIVYVNDILIASPSWEDHMKTLDQVLHTFESGGVTLNIKKSEFAKEKVQFLGHVISTAGIEPDPRKLETVRNFPEPMCKKQLQSFLVFCGYLRRYLKGHCLSSPALLSLMKKNDVWNWGPEQREAFLEIKKQLLEAPLLHPPDLKEPFCLGTDASEYGIGVHLYQIINENGQEQHLSVAFASRVLT